MVINKTVSIWLLVADGVNKGKIASQRRFTNDSSPYICQSTWAGGIELGESAMDAVLRECKEELGEVFCAKFDLSKIKLLDKVDFIEGDEKWEVSNYIGLVDEESLKTVKMHREAFNDFVFLGKDDVVYLKSSGKDPQKNRVLFDDQYKILKEIFNKKWN